MENYSKYTDDVEGIAAFAAPANYDEDTDEEKVVFMKPHEFIVDEDRLTQFMAPLYNVQEPWTETLIEEQRRLKLPTNKPTTVKKTNTLLASIIVTARRTKNDPVFAYPSGQNWWSQNSMIGGSIARRVRDALIADGVMRQITKARKGFGGMQGSCAEYTIETEWLERFDEVKTTSSRYPHLMLIRNQRSDYILDRVVSNPIKADLKAMLDYWEAHPLQYKNGEMFAARRIYNQTLDRGGRYYSSWANMKQAERLKMTIDGEPVCHVDLTAAFLTMLQAITGVSGWDVGEEFDDPYMPKRLHNRASEFPRDKIKQFITAWIGGGNSKRWKTGDNLDLFPTDKDFAEFRDAILPYFHELTFVNKKELCGMGLQKHESAILTQTMLHLKTKNVVAYPLHDCLIVKEQDADTAAFAFQQVMRFYLKRDLNALEILPAIKITMSDGSTKKVSGKRFS